MTNKKPWYKSKAIWVAVIAGVIGVVQAFGVPIPECVYVILGAFGLYSLRKAKTEV